VSVLAQLLQQKGVLTASEVARLGGSDMNPATPAPPVTVGAQAAAVRELPAPAPVTSQSKFPVTVYGTLLLNSFYNTVLGNVTDIPLLSAKQGSDPFGNDRTFGMTARQTRLGLRYQGASIAGGKLSGTVEMDFLGGKAPFGNGVNMDLPRLRLAFGRLDWSNFSFEAGQDWSIFAPLNPTSLAEFAIPSMSASGNPWIRMPQIRAEFHSAPSSTVRLLAQFAAIDPNMGDYSTAAFSATRPPGIGERGRAPGVEGRFGLTGHHDDRDFTVAMSTHYAHGRNAGNVGTTPVQLPLDSCGVALDYVLPFTKAFNLSGEIYHGRALGIFSVTTGEAILAPGSAGDRGVLSSGGWMQAQFNFTSKTQVNVAYGLDDPRVRDLPAGNRTRNQTYMGNLMYKFSPHMTMALEFRRLLTDYKNQRFANERGNHANLAFAYLF
jgi:hypothetical protein